ncbi:hypothetical protein Q5O24_14305 [Eubacteriaceae bacterium ES3]|nr:hypothetical protein Q5O24_14305 [Eubacteriaceae bacterium ES3]
MIDDEAQINSDNQDSLTEQEIKDELRRLFLGGDDWSKEACMGYFLKACQKAGLDILTVQNLALVLFHLFDEMSVDEAKQFYFSDCHAVLTGKE